MADDWTQLPQDLLQLIANKLTVYSDYVRFRAVCPHWGSSVPRVPRHLPPQFPWLMLPLSESHYSTTAPFTASLPTRPTISTSQKLLAPSFAFTPPTAGLLFSTIVDPQPSLSSTPSPWTGTISLCSPPSPTS